MLKRIILGGLTYGAAIGAAWTLLRSVPGDPCEEAAGGPPKSPPLPDIGGRVVHSNTGGISGATLKLYRCASGTATYVTSTTTDSSGDYLFEDVTGDTWYYVQAEMTGPLEGLTPASGTTNPSPLIGIGESALDVDFTFE